MHITARGCRRFAAAHLPRATKAFAVRNGDTANPQATISISPEASGTAIALPAARAFEVANWSPPNGQIGLVVQRAEAALPYEQVRRIDVTVAVEVAQHSVERHHRVERAADAKAVNQPIGVGPLPQLRVE